MQRGIRPWVVLVASVATVSLASTSGIPPAWLGYPGADDDEPATGSEVDVGAGPDHGAFDRILRQSVRNERVDYLSVRREHREDLLAYLDRMARVVPGELTRDARLAFYLNLYNATMIGAVVERFRSGYSVAERDFEVFKEPLVRAGGETFSLDHLENGIIRPGFRDPRIHVALVCAARSCPPLLPRAFRGDDLDRLLDDNMRRFLADRSRNRIDPDSKTLRLSRIFDWYADDFGGPKVVAAYVDRWTDASVADYPVEFLEYSWELNLEPPTWGRWVSVAPESVQALEAPRGAPVGNLRQGEVFEVVGSEDGWLRLERPFGAGSAWVPIDATRPYPD